MTTVKSWLSGRKPNDILWNFEKFLVNRQGEVVARFAPDVVPDAPVVTEAIEQARGLPWLSSRDRKL